jgi:phospholipase/carboxylesterase
MNPEGWSGTPSETRQDSRIPLVTAQFVPQRYEPNYAYPLLVMFHTRGGDETQLVRGMPGLSWRNYIGLGIRGADPVVRRGQVVGYGWGSIFSRNAASSHRHDLNSQIAIVRQALDPRAPLDEMERIEEAVFDSVRRARRALHIHSERIFLVGHGEGAAVAYRLGLTYPERFAGVVSLNGWLPGGFRPLGRLSACRSLRVLIVHGQWNGRSPIERTRAEAAVLRAGGLRVAFQSYPCGHRLARRMLADADTWLINQCTAETV